MSRCKEVKTQMQDPETRLVDYKIRVLLICVSGREFSHVFISVNMIFFSILCAELCAYTLSKDFPYFDTRQNFKNIFLFKKRGHLIELMFYNM